MAQRSAIHALVAVERDRSSRAMHTFHSAGAQRFPFDCLLFSVKRRAPSPISLPSVRPLSTTPTSGLLELRVDLFEIPPVFLECHCPALTSRHRRASESCDSRKSTASWGSRQYLSQRRAIGLGGGDRKMGDSSERARSAVTWRIRHAIKKLEVVHPALARHLRVSLKTGVFCSYEPEKETHWFV